MSAKLSPEIITAAIAGFETQKQHIDSQIAELRSILNGGQPDAAPAAHDGQRWKVSAAARKRMAAGQRRRWAAVKGTSEVAKTVPSKRKRRLSAAGRAAIVAALKKRWAAKRAAESKPQPVKGKKVAPAKTTARKAA